MPQAAPITTPEEVIKNYPITIGSDPEIALLSPLSNTYVNANNFITDNSNKKPFGLDGHNATAELRPDPAEDPLKHVENIRNLLFGYSKKPDFKDVYQLDFLSSAPHTGIGGHIHLGYPTIAPPDCETSNDVKLIAKLMKMEVADDLYDLLSKIKERIQENRISLATNLDILLAFPMMFIEVGQHALKRKQSYGKFGDMRLTSYGIEYRTAPSWLANEKLAKAVLCLAYSVAHQTLKKDYKIENNFLNIMNFKEEFTKHNKNLLKPFLAFPKKEVKKLELYPKYKDNIEYLFYHAERENILLSREIKTGWRIPYIVIKNLTLFTVQELIQRLTQALSAPKNQNFEKYFIESTSSDYQIPDIAMNINSSLGGILSQNIIREEHKSVYIYAKKREYGNIVVIKYDKREGIDVEKIKRLPLLINDIARALNFTDHIDVKLLSYDYSDFNASESEHRVRPNQIARVGIGRIIREQQTYLAEAIVLTTLLYFNSKLYQAYKIDKKTGRRTTLPLIGRSIVKTIKNNLGDKTKRPSEVTEDTTAL